MSLKDELSSKIAADREAGRDIPAVIEEMFLMIVDFLEPEETVKGEATQPKADPAPEQAVQEEIKDPPQQMAPDPANQSPVDGAVQQ